MAASVPQVAGTAGALRELGAATATDVEDRAFELGSRLTSEYGCYSIPGEGSGEV